MSISGIKAVADYVHSKGLLFGVYTAQGSRTCQDRPGAYNHELVDAQTYCDWVRKKKGKKGGARDEGA